MVETDCDFDEHELIERLKTGEKEAFGPLVERYKKKAYCIALGYVRNADDALELSQMAFIKAYRSIRHFDNSKNFFPWFYSILRNTCLNHLNARKMRREDGLEDLPEGSQQQVFVDARNPEESFRQAELQRIMGEAILKLRPRDREVILMQHFHELSYSQIAEALDIPIGTVMSRLYNARTALRKLLERTGQPGGLHEL
jgi:RNA polymerase sigma-70 factor (ECF subfamily)